MDLTVRKFDSFYGNAEVGLEKEDELSFASSMEHIKRYWRGNGLFLEAGCGRGQNALLLAREGAMVVGLDISLGALRVGKQLFERDGQKGWLVCGDMMNLPLKSNLFSLVYAGGSIEHFEDTVAAVKELRRVLADEGLLTSTVPYLSISSLTYRQLSGNIPDVFPLKGLAELLHMRILGGRHMIYGYEKSFTERKLRHIFRLAGFSDVEVGLFETYYEMRMLRIGFLKEMARKRAHFRPFWPMVYVNGRRND